MMKLKKIGEGQGNKPTNMDPIPVYYRKKRGHKKIIILAFLILLFILIFPAYYYWRQVSAPNSNDVNKANFVVNTGQSSSEIADNLKKNSLIKNPLIFELYGWQSGLDDKLQSGEYEIPKNLSIKDIFDLLSAAKIIQEQKITIIEGWNIRDIGTYLESEGVGTNTDFIYLVQKKADWWDSYDFLALKPKDVDLEGYIFPDTYRIFKGTTLEDIVKKCLDNFGRKLTAELRAEIAKQGKTIHEVVTLASIIEREVASDPDRKVVAGIFYKRLKINMALQSDATVNYATGIKTVRPTSDDLEVDSPYNTYKHPGLPPGPINNPSLSAILAAIYPEDSPYLYFLTTPEGAVKYSKTYNEHLKYKNQYWP